MLLAFGRRLRPHASGGASFETESFDHKYKHFCHFFPKAADCENLTIAESGAGPGDLSLYMATKAQGRSGAV
jgi:hypothetical protein